MKKQSSVDIIRKNGLPRHTPLKQVQGRLLAMTNNGWPAKLFIFIINIYRYCISPLNPPCCRYVPTCSEYAIEAFKRYNLAKAAFLTIKRIARCNPWGGSGFDPVPENNIKPNKTNG